MLEYIIFAQNVEKYGVEHFSIQWKGAELLDNFGIENRGVVINELNVAFQWDEISNMEVHEKKFVIKFIEGSVSPVGHSMALYGFNMYMHVWFATVTNIDLKQ